MNTLNKYITLPHKKTAVLRPQGSPKSEPTKFILLHQLLSKRTFKNSSTNIVLFLNFLIFFEQ